MTRALPCPRPWTVIALREGRGTYPVQCIGRADWLREWRKRIAAIEGAAASAAHRRAELERALAANRDAFRATAELGSVAAVLDATALAAAADGRLSHLTEDAGAA